MSKTIRQYSSGFKHDAVQYVESHPDISMQDAAHENSRCLKIHYLRIWICLV